MHTTVRGDPAERLDALLRRVGEWLLVGYTVALVLVTFVGPEPSAAAPGNDDPPVEMEIVLG